jgi:two-component system, OmpR family, sensor histidine kinase KdpD
MMAAGTAGKTVAGSIVGNARPAFAATSEDVIGRAWTREIFAAGRSVIPYAGSLGMVTAALALGLALRRFLGVSDLALIFLTAVLASAVRYGLWPSLFACLASVLACDFFFVPPIYSLAIANSEDVVTLATFAAVAVIVSHLAARVRAQAFAARRQTTTSEELCLFARRLAGIADLGTMSETIVHQIALTLDRRVTLLLPLGDRLVVHAAYPPGGSLDEADLAAANRAWLGNRLAGHGIEAPGADRRLCLPMRTGDRRVGVIALSSEQAGGVPVLTGDQRRLADALTDQAALAVERHRLAQEIEKARIAAATEQLRAALLTSISHDLRTPLTGILGAATTLKNFRDTLGNAPQEGSRRSRRRRNGSAALSPTSST